MEYWDIREVSQKWGISSRRIQTLCAEGRIKGAVRFGRAWMVPADAQKPTDGRTRKGRQEQFMKSPENRALPRKTPFLYMTDLYSRAGGAEESIEMLSDHYEAKVLLAAEIAYSRGEIDKVYDWANYLLEKHSGFYAILSAGMLLALCAIWKGDLWMWRKAKVHIAEAPAATEQERDIVAFSLTAVDSILYDVTSFPDWFKIGCFEPLHRDSLPAAKVFYVKYLYATAYALATKEVKMEGMQGLSLMSMLPYIMEPMISQAMVDRTVIAEIYLRLTCASAYHNSGNDIQTCRHIDRAIALALPDRLYGLLAEYCRPLGTLLEQRILQTDPVAGETVRKLHKVHNEGWSKLSGSVRGRHIYTTLSPKEREVAKLAAFGMKNSDIAAKLHMSVSAVKQAVTKVMQKTGMARDEFAAIL